MKKKEITLCGQSVSVAYCAASENGFEYLTGKSISDIDIKLNTDIIRLSMACIVAAYECDGQEPPIKSEELLYNATPKELTDLYLTVLNLRSDWYGLPKIISDKLKKEEEEMTDEDKAEAAKNAQAPTNDTAAS